MLAGYERMLRVRGSLRAFAKDRARACAERLSGGRRCARADMRALHGRLSAVHGNFQRVEQELAGRLRALLGEVRARTVDRTQALRSAMVPLLQQWEDLVGADAAVAQMEADLRAQARCLYSRNCWVSRNVLVC